MNDDVVRRLDELDGPELPARLQCMVLPNGRFLLVLDGRPGQDAPSTGDGRRNVTARAVCPSCGREMAVAPLSSGDGSVAVFPRHPPTGRRRCAGSRQVVQAADYASDSNRTV